MNAFCARVSLVIITLLLCSPVVRAGTLDDYYLKQFGELNNVSVQKAVSSEFLETQESARCGMPLKHGLSRDWNKLETTTQKVLTKQLAAPTLSGSEQLFLSSSGKFLIHYTTSNGDAVPSVNWVQTVAQTLEDVASAYQTRGWRLAPTVNSAPYDVYLRDLAPSNVYGQVTAPPNSGFAVPSPGFTNAYASYMELDNDFTESLFTNAPGGPYTPLQSLQITAAHEYHHAIQYGYNYYFDIWYAEATSTWLEDELYDGVNQLYNYIPAWFTQSTLSLDIPVSITTGGGYGRWIFNRYLSERHGSTMIRGVWEKVAGLASPGSGADIPMVPVLESTLSSPSYGSSLDNDFFDFAKRVYSREWTSHLDDLSRIHPYSPITSSFASSSPSPVLTLPHYSFAYYRFVPAAGAPGDLPITITGTSGITATAFRKNGSAIVEFPFAGVNGATVTVPNFSTATEVVLLVANATDTDSHQVTFSTNGTGLAVTEPPDVSVYPSTPSNSSSSSSSGCFIATAAYGSYLHPQVQHLRDFRDRYLLTNAPGRAFVALYYRCSPPLADFISRHAVLRSATRVALTPLVMAVTHPVIAAILLLFLGAAFMARLHRINIARSNVHLIA